MASGISAGKKVLAFCTLLTTGTIAYVHYTQFAERERMRAAVLREIEQERTRSA